MKKIITIMLTFIFMLCFSVAAFASQLYDVGYYAILKDRFSPTDPLITNHLVKYVGQNPEYYRFFQVYTSHDHADDEYQAYRESISLSIHTRAIVKPVEIVNGYWQDIKTHDLDTGTIAATVEVKLSGAFAAKPILLYVTDSATHNDELYLKTTGFTEYEQLNVNTALIDILNGTGPHPGWDSQIAGSKGLPY